MENEIKVEDIPEEEEKDPWWKGPIKFVIMIFLLLILTMWVFSYYAVKVDPSPSKIPKLEDVFEQNYDVSISEERNIKRKGQYRMFVNSYDPVIKLTADKIASYSCTGGKVCHAKAIYLFVRDNFQYVSDPNEYEYVKSARESLATGTGDCDDASVLAANLLEAVGVPTRFAFIPGHVYIQAFLPEASSRYKADGEWVNLDLTCSYCEFGEIPWKNWKKEVEYV